MFKWIKKINRAIEQHIEEQCWEEYEKEWEFVWGIRSQDDLHVEQEANLYSMNDFEILYNKASKYYTMSIETIYCFERGIKGEQDYVSYILEEFTKWMKQKKYSINHITEMNKIFIEATNVNTKFNSIEELYCYFKILANGFCSQKGEG